MSNRRALQEKKMLDFLNKFPQVASLKDRNLENKTGNIQTTLTNQRTPTATNQIVSAQVPNYKPIPIPMSQMLKKDNKVLNFSSVSNSNSKGNLVTVILNCGLGNWIFKILAGLGYTEKYGKQFVLCKTYMHYGTKKHEQQLEKYIQRLFPNITYVDSVPNSSIMEEVMQMNYSPLENRHENIVLKGYFQDIRYFPSAGCLPKVKTKYYLNTYFIHIRAGDYLEYPGEWEFDIKKYHLKCFSLLGDVNYIVFSNDNAYAENYIKQFDIKYTISDKEDPLDTLIEMANCTGGICANSTLSWLGAFFQGDKRGHIFMPPVWNKIKDCSGIYPPWATVFPEIPQFKHKPGSEVIRGGFVSIILTGGIGNRLFQIFAGLAYAKKHVKKFVLSESLNEERNDYEKNTKSMICSIFPEIEWVPFMDTYTLIHEITPMNYNELDYFNGNVVLKGSFQVEQYSLELENVPTIRTDYYENTYFIHIRLGDYVGHPEFDIDLSTYHKNCIDMLGYTAKYIVFSNDNHNARKYLEQFKIDYILSDKTDPLETLVEMANCAGGICMNSAFSWMGAFFQRLPRKHVFVPARWSQRKSSGVFPSWAARIDF